jgi:hypothetical protein
MPGPSRGAFRSLQAISLCAWVGSLAAGCGGTSSADQALDQQLKASDATREVVASFAGKVTVDGQPPAPGSKESLVVILYDPAHPSTPEKPPRFTFCGKEGRFEFHTYLRGDGVPVGSYVVLFAQLKTGGRGSPGFKPPDALKNLYNDPEKNALVPELKIDHTAPGRTDYAFDLAVAGKDPIAEPGPKAITQIRLR